MLELFNETGVIVEIPDDDTLSESLMELSIISVVSSSTSDRNASKRTVGW